MYNVKCDICGIELSSKVFRVHYAWCKSQQKKKEEFYEKEPSKIENEINFTKEELSELNEKELYKLCVENEIEVEKKKDKEYYISKLI